MALTMECTMATLRGFTKQYEYPFMARLQVLQGLLPREERRKHEMERLMEQLSYGFATPVLVLACRCGWHEKIEFSNRLVHASVMGGQEGREFFEEELVRVTNAAEAHLNEVLAPYQPTIADLSDWGWFHTESAAEAA